MANPVTHVLVPMLLMETYRRYISKKPISKWYVFLAGFFGGMPDFDLLYALARTGSFDLTYHRGITHTLLIPFFLLIVGLVVYGLYKKKVISYPGWEVSYMLMFLAAFGITTHILLDGVDSFSTWFYPLSWTVYLPDLKLNEVRAALLDGVLLFVWLLYDKEKFNQILRFLRLRK